MGLFSILKDKSSSKDRPGSGQVPAADGLLQVSGRAKSEYHSQKKQAQFTVAHDGAPESPKIAAMYSSGASKSFTASSPAAHMAQLSAAAAAADRHTEAAGPSPASVHYTSLNQFQNKVELYRGSISTVYKALCIATRQAVIIKSYEKAKMKQKNFLRMEREIKLMNMLGGDGLVQLYSVFEEDTHKHLIMEFCKGGDLFKLLLLRGGTLEEHWVCMEIIVPMLRVLVQMHSDHIIHRDIKPENIFLTSRTKFKMGDLGLAIRATEELPFTRSGTLDYMAPEVLANPTADIQEGPTVTKADLKARGVRPYDEKVDVWATGILAYELVVGRPPFEVNDEVQTATMIMFSNNINFPTKYSTLWVDFVRAALEKKPHLRPSAVQLLDHPWVKLHERRAAVAAAPQAAAAEQGVAPLPSVVVNTVAALPEPSQLPPVTPAVVAAAVAAMPPAVEVAAARAAAFQKSASMGSALHHPGLQRLQQQQAEKAAAPAAAEQAARQQQQQQRAAAAAHLKHSVPEAHTIDSSGGSFTALLQSARNRPGGPGDAGEPLTDADKAGGIKSRMKHYFHRQLGTEIPSDIRKEAGIV